MSQRCSASQRDVDVHTIGCVMRVAELRSKGRSCLGHRDGSPTNGQPGKAKSSIGVLEIAAGLQSNEGIGIDAAITTGDRRAECGYGLSDVVVLPCTIAGHQRCRTLVEQFGTQIVGSRQHEVVEGCSIADRLQQGARLLRRLQRLGAFSDCAEASSLSKSVMPRLRRGSVSAGSLSQSGRRFARACSKSACASTACLVAE